VGAWQIPRYLERSIRARKFGGDWPYILTAKIQGMPLSLKFTDGEPADSFFSAHSSFSSIADVELTAASSVAQQHALPHQPTATTSAHPSSAAASLRTEELTGHILDSGSPPRSAAISTPLRSIAGNAAVLPTERTVVTTPTQNYANCLVATPTRSPAARTFSAWAPVTPEPAAECPICFETIHAGSAFRSSCGHGYHKQCLSQWRAMHQHQCPLCRAALPRGVGLTPVNHASPPPHPPLLPEQTLHFGATRGQVASAAQRVRRSMELRRAMEQEQAQRRQASGLSEAVTIAPPCH
jgi:hypothetical protein